MANIFVQFEDANRERIVSTFSAPQDPDFFPFQGEVEDDDSRYIAFREELLVFPLG